MVDVRTKGVAFCIRCVQACSTHETVVGSCGRCLRVATTRKVDPSEKRVKGNPQGKCCEVIFKSMVDPDVLSLEIRNPLILIHALIDREPLLERPRQRPRARDLPQARHLTQKTIMPAARTIVLIEVLARHGRRRTMRILRGVPAEAAVLAATVGAEAAEGAAVEGDAAGPLLECDARGPRGVAVAAFREARGAPRVGVLLRGDVHGGGAVGRRGRVHPGAEEGRGRHGEILDADVRRELREGGREVGRRRAGAGQAAEAQVLQAVRRLLARAERVVVEARRTHVTRGIGIDVARGARLHGDAARERHEGVEGGGLEAVRGVARGEGAVELGQGRGHEGAEGGALELGQRGVDGHGQRVQVRDDEQVGARGVAGGDEADGRPEEAHAERLQARKELLQAHGARGHVEVARGVQVLLGRLAQEGVAVQEGEELHHRGEGFFEGLVILREDGGHDAAHGLRQEERLGLLRLHVVLDELGEAERELPFGDG